MSTQNPGSPKEGRGSVAPEEVSEDDENVAGNGIDSLMFTPLITNRAIRPKRKR